MWSAIGLFISVLLELCGGCLLAWLGHVPSRKVPSLGTCKVIYIHARTTYGLPTRHLITGLNRGNFPYPHHSCWGQREPVILNVVLFMCQRNPLEEVYVLECFLEQAVD